MPQLLGYILLFLAVGIGFIFVHLIVGKLVRPAKPHAEKLTIYECGEPTIGSAWIQFDLRFYVVALLFVIFDVEVAFFFPWALVFNKANELARPNLPDEQRVALVRELQPAKAQQVADRQKSQQEWANNPNDPRARDYFHERLGAQRFGLIAFVDILVFFGVLLVGYAYLWKRGDLEWVRSTAAEQAPAEVEAAPPLREGREVAGAGHGS